MFDQLWWALALLLVVRILAGRADLAGGWPSVSPSASVLEPSGRWPCSHWGWRGLVATPWAAATCSPWLAAGVVVALALWLPNLVWQGLNGWPSVEFSRNNNANVRDDEGRLGFLLQQIVLVGPLALPLAAAGLVWLWRRPLAGAGGGGGDRRARPVPSWGQGLLPRSHLRAGLRRRQRGGRALGR